MKDVDSKDARLSIVELAARIIEEQHGDTIEMLQLGSLCIENSQEPEQEEKQLITALVNSKITGVQTLYLEDNPTWFKNAETADQLLSFIKRQTKLASL